MWGGGGGRGPERTRLVSTTSAPPIKHTHSRCCLNYSAHTHTHTHTHQTIDCFDCSSAHWDPTRRGHPFPIHLFANSISWESGGSCVYLHPCPPCSSPYLGEFKERENHLCLISVSVCACVCVCMCVCVCVREGLFIEKSPRAKEGEHWVPSHGSNIISNNSIRPFISSIDIILLPGSHIRL